MMLDNIKVCGEWLFYIDDRLILKHKNLITNLGLNILAKLLTGEITLSSMHLALGTGTTAPNATDISLENELIRKQVSSKISQDNYARLRTMFQSAEANGTWTEAGIFINGTDTIGTGTLFNRITPPGGISKSSQQVLTIEIRLTFNNL